MPTLAPPSVQPPTQGQGSDEFWSWTAPGGSEVSLQQGWLGIATIGGSRFGLPTLRGSDIEVAFRAGTSRRRKFPNARTITLVMWEAGVDQTTNAPAQDQRLAWNDNWRELRQMFWLRDGLGSLQGMLTRRWFLSVGGPGIVQASAMAEIAGGMEPTMTGRTRADFSVDLLLADPYFYGVKKAVTVAAGNSSLLVNDGEGVVGEGQPGGLASFQVVLTGPLTTPTLLNVTAGVSVTYLGTIGSGTSVTLDILSYTAVDSAGVNRIAQVKHAGSRMWLCLLAGQRSVNTLELSTLSGADTGTANVSWTTPYV